MKHSNSTRKMRESWPWREVVFLQVQSEVAPGLAHLTDLPSHCVRA